jgi:uncharacterized protein (TIGR02118 family)
MALAEFHAHWRSRHAELVTRLPGIRGYVQNFPFNRDAAYDAIAESSFDDTAAMKALARTPAYAEVLADEPNFIDAASMGSVITEEHVLREGPAAGAKAIRLVGRRTGMPVDDFFASFLEHGRAAARAPGVLRYVQCHTRRSAYESSRVPAYDGVEMIWCAKDAAPADLPLFADRERSSSLAVIERIVTLRGANGFPGLGT